MIDSTELLEHTLKSLLIDKIHPLHEAMFAECCDVVIESIDKEREYSTQDLVLHVQSTFIVANDVFKAMARGLFAGTDCDQITLNYRDESFTIKRDSTILENY